MKRLQETLGGGTISAVIAVLSVAIVLCVGIGLLTLSKNDTGTQTATNTPQTAPTPTPSASPAVPIPESAPAPGDQFQSEPVLAAIQSGVKKANARGGTSGAAVWVEGWDEPVTAGYDRTYRLWSTSKPLTAIGVLDRQTKPDPQVDEAMHDALVKSSNCGQRRMVIELQDLAGGIAGAEAAFTEVASRSSISDLTQPQQDASSACDSYLSQLGVTDLPQAAALFGPVEWTTSDSASFAKNLGAGTYGASGKRVLDQLKMPKEKSDDPLSGESVKTNLSWGAGDVFPPSWNLGYKSGWGGTDQENYLASQLVSLNIGGIPVGVSAVFMPDQQPSNDAVGQGPEDDALEDIFTEVRKSLSKQMESGNSGVSGSD